MNLPFYPGGLAKSPRVAIVSGFWGQNIGNAFFNIGGKWILDQIFGPDNVAFIQDQPGYRTFHNQLKGNPYNDLTLLKYLDIDYIVLQGPLLTKSFRSLWEETFTKLIARNTKIILLGSAFFKFTDEEAAAAKSMLEQFPPALISTRDTRTYDRIKSWELGIPLYDGMDSAFFVPKAYTPFELTISPYVVLNFDRFPEPTIENNAVKLSDADVVISTPGNRSWRLKEAKVASYFAHLGKASAYLGHLLDRRKLPVELDGLTVVRPEHRFNPHMTYKIYKQGNAVASDEPWTYFNIYANAEFVLADRVHACVAALAYGRSAMLFTPSPRQALFARVGVGEIRNKLQSVDLDWLERERQNQVAWLRAKI